MRKPLMVVAAAALSVASLAGCKLDVTPIDETPSVGATTINGDDETVFSQVATQLGTYSSSGSTDDGEVCEWDLFEDDNNDDGSTQQRRDGGDNLVADGPDAGIEEDVDEDEAQTFQLRKGDARLVAEGCETFVRIGD